MDIIQAVREHTVVNYVQLICNIDFLRVVPALEEWSDTLVRMIGSGRDIVFAGPDGKGERT
jgi:hypothetical protein|eukprot:COSAG01_NODE_141_length_24253_cov_36.101130_1_plen_61_part_00